MYQLIPWEDDHRSSVQNCDQDSTDSTDTTDNKNGTDRTDVTDNVENNYDTMDNTDDDVEKDAIGAKYMQMDRSVCFLENAVFVVEVPVSEHNKPKVKEAKVK